METLFFLLGDMSELDGYVVQSSPTEYTTQGLNKNFKPSGGTCLESQH